MVPLFHIQWHALFHQVASLTNKLSAIAFDSMFELWWEFNLHLSLACAFLFQFRHFIFQCLGEEAEV